MIYKGAIESAMTYGSPIWASALNNQKRQGEVTYRAKKLNKAQGQILRTINRAYRTTSDETNNMLAGVKPLDIKINEIAAIWNMKNIQGYKIEYRGEGAKAFMVAHHSKTKWPMVPIKIVKDIAVAAQGHSNEDRSEIESDLIEDKISIAKQNEEYLITTEGTLGNIVGRRLRTTELELGEILSNLLRTKWAKDLKTNARNEAKIYTKEHIEELIVNSNSHTESAKELYWRNPNRGGGIVIYLKEPEINRELEYDAVTTIHNPKLVIENWANKWWQDRWTKTKTGDRVKTLLPSVEDRLKYKWLQPTKEISQVITGHGNFNRYLNKMGKKQSEECEVCQKVDNVEHYLYECGKYTVAREHMHNALIISGAQFAGSRLQQTKEIISNREAYWQLKKFIQKTDK